MGHSDTYNARMTSWARGEAARTGDNVIEGSWEGLAGIGQEGHDRRGEVGR